MPSARHLDERRDEIYINILSLSLFLRDTLTVLIFLTPCNLSKCPAKGVRKSRGHGSRDNPPHKPRDNSRYAP
jgi:hypothetical protein